MREWALRYAQLTFERCGRNRSRACRVLDISYHTLRGYLGARGTRRAPQASLPSRREPPQLAAWIRSASDPAATHEQKVVP